MAVDDRAEYTQRRFGEIARALREAPPGSRLELRAQDIAGFRADGSKEATWLAIWDAAEAYVAGREIERQFPGPAIVLFLSAINRFLTGGDDEARQSIDRATATLKANDAIWNDPDVKRLRELAIQRAGFARVTGYLKKQVEGALLASGFEPSRASYLAKGTAEAGNETRHRAQITGSYSAAIVQRDDGRLLLGVTEEHVKQGLRFDPGDVVANVVLHKFDEFAEPARLGASYTIAQHAVAIGLGAPRS